MRVDVHAHICEPVTIVHRAEGPEDSWTATTYPECMWYAPKSTTVDAQGLASGTDSVRVQVPQDQGVPEVAFGDYVVRGKFEAEGVTRAELVKALPASARTVRAIRDLTSGGISATGEIARWATVTYLEAS